jgi:hypothetical protein
LFFELAEFNEFHYGFNNPVQAPDQWSYFSPSTTPTPLQSAFLAGSTPPLSQAFISINPDSHLRQPYIHEWSFSIESQLTSSMALEVRYVGTSAIELGHFHFFGNQAVPGPGDIQPRRLYPDFGVTAQMSSGANANYNGLQVQFTRRMSNGLQFLAGYTWSKNISNNEGEEGGYSDGGAPLGQNDNNQRGERGLTVNDVRHRVTFSSIYELPFGKGKRWLGNTNALVNGILGGWEFTALASFQTGFPITPHRPPALVDLYRRLEATVESFGGVEVVTRNRYALFRTTRIFADLTVMRDALRVVIHLGRKASAPHFIKIVQGDKRVHCGIFTRFPPRFGRSPPATAFRMLAGVRRIWDGCRSRGIVR